MPTLVIDGAEHPLTGELTFGRHRSCGIQIKDDGASRQHAKVYFADGIWWVEDLGSANGTFLNGTKITTRKRLRDRDAIGIGQVILRFDAGEDGSSSQAVAAVKAAPQVDDAKATAAHSGGPALEPKAGAKPATASTANGIDITKFSGKEIAGYRIGQYLGRGMLGSVYKAQQLNLDRPVAFKIFDPARCDRDAGLAKRFLAEAGKVGSVTHDGLVQLHESGQHEGVLWCSMEWIDGDTLERLLARDGGVDPMMALLITEKVAEALAVAHATGVVHGDLRPSHVIVMGDGRVKLTDVGMMGIFEEAELPSKGPASLAWYLSPEEATEGISDPRSDIYSLGCLLFHLLAGRPPFTGADTGAVLRAHATQPIPAIATAAVRPLRLDTTKVDALLQGLLAKNRAWRHGTMEEVLAELRPLREAQAKTPSEMRPALGRKSSETRGPTERRAAPAANGLFIVVTAALVLVILAVAMAIVLPKMRRPVEEPPVVVTPVAAMPEVRPVVKPTVATPAPTPAVAPAAALSATWVQVQAAVDQATAQHQWPAAEQQLTDFAAQAANDPALLRQVAARQQQLSSDGEQWYQDELVKLPGGDAAGDLAERLRQIAVLRDAVTADSRPDAESRYQEALTKLGQRLNAAKRQARQAVEGGRVSELPKIASDLAPVFARTPVADLHRQFAVLCNEAAGIRPWWAVSWAVTKPKLLATKGADSLAAAAALLLTGDSAEARALLANDPALASGDLLRRREALFGRRAAVLTFDEPDDLQYVEVITGTPRMAGGALTGAPGEPIGLSCSAPLGAAGWDVAVGVTLEQAMADGQAVISLAHDDKQDAHVRIEREAIHVQVATANGLKEARIARPASKLLRIRLAERGGTVSIYLNDQVVLQAPQAKVAKGSLLRFDAVGMVWGLTDLQIVGGE